MKRISANIFLLFAEGYRTVTSGWQGAPLLQEIRPRAGFRSGDFPLKKRWEGYRRRTTPPRHRHHRVVLEPQEKLSYQRIFNPTLRNIGRGTEPTRATIEVALAPTFLFPE